jgi:hypothetical protein
LGPSTNTPARTSTPRATRTNGVSQDPSGERLSCRGLSVRSAGDRHLDRLCPLLHRHQDLTAQHDRLGVAEDRIYLDRGLTGTNRARPGLDQALAAVRAGDTLVVPKLDRLARSVPDARQIGDTLTGRNAVMILLSDDARFITGQKLLVDGGQNMW